MTRDEFDVKFTDLQDRFSKIFTEEVEVDLDDPLVGWFFGYFESATTCLEQLASKYSKAKNEEVHDGDAGAAGSETEES